MSKPPGAMEKKTLLTIAFAGVVTLFPLAQETSSPGKQLMTPREFRASRPIDPTLIGCALVLLAAAGSGVILTIIQNKRHARRTAELRFHWRQKIEQIADDLTTTPDGWSLDDIINCLDEPEWEEICFELEKMRAGKRSLQKAIEITDRAEYRRGV